MNFLHLEKLQFPKEALQIVNDDTLKIILGGSDNEILSIKGKEFYVPRENLLRSRRATTILMWSSGYYSYADIAKIFGVSRQAICQQIQQLRKEQNLTQLSWLTIGYIRDNTEIGNYVYQYFKANKFDCRYVLGKTLINPGLDLLLAEHKEILSKKVCAICSKNIPNFVYCPECRPLSHNKPHQSRKPKPLTWETCHEWAKPIFLLSHNGKIYVDLDFVFYDEAAQIAGVTDMVIFRNIKTGLFTHKRFSVVDKAGYRRLKTAVPREQAELYSRLNPYLKSRKPVP